MHRPRRCHTHDHTHTITPAAQGLVRDNADFRDLTCDMVGRPEADVPAFFPSVNVQTADSGQMGFIPFSNYDSDYVSGQAGGLRVCLSKGQWDDNIHYTRSLSLSSPLSFSHIRTHAPSHTNTNTNTTGLLVHGRRAAGAGLRHGGGRDGAHRGLGPLQRARPRGQRGARVSLELEQNGGIPILSFRIQNAWEGVHSAHPTTTTLQEAYAVRYWGLQSSELNWPRPSYASISGRMMEEFYGGEEGWDRRYRVVAARNR